MYLTNSDVMNFSPDCYVSIGAINRAIYDRYSCVISEETARRIIADYHLTH